MTAWIKTKEGIDMHFVSYHPFGVLEGNPITLHPSKTETDNKATEILNAAALAQLSKDTASWLFVLLY